MSVRPLVRAPADDGSDDGVGVDPRIAARRRQVAALAGRRRQRRLLVLVVAFTAAALAWMVTRSPLLDVDDVTVEGAIHTPTEEVLAAAGAGPGDQLLDVDVDGARERLLVLPWVADASVAVDWPSAVRVSIREREPVAVARRADGTGWLVDAEGRVLAPARADERLVVIEGVEVGDPGDALDPAADGALALIAQLPPGVASRLEAVVVTPAGHLDGRTRAEPQGAVWFGPPTELAAKVATVQTLFAQVDDTEVSVWDVRVPGTGVVTRVPPQPPVPDETDAGSSTAADG
jgi:cell division protein FtsQ